MKLALYIAFHNKSSIDCCKEIIDIIPESEDLIIDSKLENELNNQKLSFFDSSRKIDFDVDFAI